MGTPFIGEIRIIGFNFPPRGWAFCNGQLLAINQNQALFSILGTTYGGNGQTNFALPNLQGRVPIHPSNNVPLGGVGGEQSHTLTVPEMPGHTHSLEGSSSAADQQSPQGTVWAQNDSTIYAAGSANTTMSPGAITNGGSSQPHPNMPPYGVVNFVIALQGIYPSRN